MTEPSGLNATLDAMRRSLAAIWRRLTRHDPAPPSNFDLASLLALVLGYFALSAVIGYLLDQAVVRAMPPEPKGGLFRFLAWMSYIGRTSWMFVLAGLLGLYLSTGPLRHTRIHRALVARFHANVTFIFVALALSGIAAVLLKITFGRARPRFSGPDFQTIFEPFAATAHMASFPSGHATTAGCIAALVALLEPRWRWTALMIGLVLAISRVIFTVHYPSDVLFGFGLGAGLVFALAAWLARRRVMFEFLPGRALPRREPPPLRLRPLQDRAAANPRSMSAIRSEASSSPT